MGDLLWQWFAQYAVPFFRNCFAAVFAYWRLLFSVFRFIFKNGWTLVAGYVALLVWTLNKLADLVNSLDLNALSKPAGTMLQYYVFMDRFVPLSEAFAGAVICYHIWFVLIVIRWIKSFLPLFSN